MFIIFGGNIYEERRGCDSIICLMENKEYAIEIASNFISFGYNKDDTWSQVYDVNEKIMIYSRNDCSLEEE